MRAVAAIYECGKVHFQFEYPNTEGPVAVLVIFPDDTRDGMSYEEEWPPEHDTWEQEF